MAKDPAFLFYSQDWITGTLVMNFEDRGKYITILSLMHQQGRMAEETICFLVGSISVMLKSKFKVDENGLWYNVKLEEETEKRNSYTKSRHENGSKGGRPKKGEEKKKPYGKARRNHMDNHMGNENENENKDINSNKKRSKNEFCPPSEIDVIDYFTEKGYTEGAAKIAFEYYAAADWHDSKGEKVKNWKQKMLSVWFKPENKLQNGQQSTTPGYKQPNHGQSAGAIKLAHSLAADCNINQQGGTGNTGNEIPFADIQ